MRSPQVFPLALPPISSGKGCKIKKFSLSVKQTKKNG
jgi:hypothetical protein